MNILQKYIRTFCNLSDESWIILKDCTKELSVRKGTELLKYNEICNSIYFIISGYCKSFYNLNGKEINTAFYFENDFLTNIKSLRSGEKSEYSIKSCENLKAIEFERLRLIEAYKKSPEIESMGRNILELILEKQEEHNNIMKLLTPKQRYEYLIIKHPHILQRVSLTQISSYLGISRETLTRIRKKQ